jgi:arsenate reductase
VSVTIYHNPRCSKSRQTLALLRECGIEPAIVEYLETPPSAAVLADILKLLGRAPRQLMRCKEAPYTKGQNE